MSKAPPTYKEITPEMIRLNDIIIEGGGCTLIGALNQSVSCTNKHINKIVFDIESICPHSSCNHISGLKCCDGMSARVGSGGDEDLAIKLKEWLTNNTPIVEDVEE